MSNKITKFIFIALLVEFCLNDNSKYLGCIHIVDENCEICYQGTPLGIGKGCGPVQQTQGNCVALSRDVYSGAIFCEICAAFHALDVEQSNNFVNACKPQINIPGCISGYKWGFNPIDCAGCLNNLYADSKTKYRKCVPGGKFTIENCMWGGKVDSKGSNCFRCVPGYALSWNRTKCETPNVPGCLRNDLSSGKCYSCDFYRGYYVVPGGKCVKEQTSQ